MESSLPSDPVLLRERGEVLRQVVAVLQEELAIVGERRWEGLPELKKRKVVLASKLRSLRLTPDAVASPEEMLIPQLEAQSSRQVEAQMDLIGRQIVALQEIQQFGRECLSVSFGKYC